jgi:Tol biopolymer transport system component
MVGYRAGGRTAAEYAVQRLTNTSGVTGWPALSADGRLVAYASDGGEDGAALQIWVQQVGGPPVKLTDCAMSCTDPSFSADGRRVVYTARDPVGQSLYEVPVNGGGSRLLRRSARAGRWSPDGHWLAFISDDPPHGVHVATRDGARVHVVSRGFVVGDFAVWSPSGRRLLVRARRDQEQEPDWWIVAPDGGAAHNTQVLRWLGDRGFAGRWHTVLPPAWPEETSLVFSDGTNLWQQRLTTGLPQPHGEPEQLTRGAPMAWFAAAGGGRVAFVSSNPDVNLRSVAIDPHSGVAFGPLRRVTRGSGVVQYPSVSNDGRVLAYASSRAGSGDVFLRELGSGKERTLAHTAAREAYSTVSPSGRTVAYGIVVAGDRAVRPIVVVSIGDGRSRQICADCGGRPRAWLNERTLIVERHDRAETSLALLDVEDGSTRPLIDSPRGSVSNPRVAPDARWIAFDFAPNGRSSEVFIGLLDGERPVPEERWTLVAAQAKYPFWSIRGDLLYFVSERGDVRARRINPESGVPQGEPFQVFATSELQTPTWLPGTAPVALSDALVMVLADLRGDVWLMNLRD